MKCRVAVRLAAGVCAFMVLACPAFAHSGRTDSRGGHYDRSTGEYHYHHGYSAHQHENGVCPYDYNDATDHYYKGVSDSKATPRPTVKPTVKPTLKPAVTAQPRGTVTPAAKKLTRREGHAAEVLAVGLYLFIMVGLPLIDHSRKKRKKRK